MHIQIQNNTHAQTNHNYGLEKLNSTKSASLSFYMQQVTHLPPTDFERTAKILNTRATDTPTDTAGTSHEPTMTTRKTYLLKDPESEPLELIMPVTLASDCVE